jgi:hypothetical protein
VVIVEITVSSDVTLCTFGFKLLALICNICPEDGRCCQSVCHHAPPAQLFLTLHWYSSSRQQC